MPHFIIYHRASGQVTWQATQASDVPSVAHVFPGVTTLTVDGVSYPIEEFGLFSPPLEQVALLADQPDDFAQRAYATLHAAQRLGGLRVQEDARGGLPSLRMASSEERAQFEARRQMQRAKERSLEIAQELEKIRAAIAGGAPAAVFAEDTARLQAERDGINQRLRGERV